VVNKAIIKIIGQFCKRLSLLISASDGHVEHCFDKSGWYTRNTLYTGWSDDTVICGHNTISMLWGNTAYCVKLSADLLRYSN